MESFVCPSAGTSVCQVWHRVMVAMDSLVYARIRGDGKERKRVGWAILSQPPTYTHIYNN